LNLKFIMILELVNSKFNQFFIPYGLRHLRNASIKLYFICLYYIFQIRNCCKVNQIYYNDTFNSYLGARGPERPMCGIMEHAWGWCK
jgi:hypothetical protein